MSSPPPPVTVSLLVTRMSSLPPPPSIESAPAPPRQQIAAIAPDQRVAVRPGLQHGAAVHRGDADVLDVADRRAVGQGPTARRVGGELDAGQTRRVDEGGVDAVAPIEAGGTGQRPRTREGLGHEERQRVVAATALQPVTVLTGQAVVARAPLEQVLPEAAAERVVAVAALQRVVARAVGDDVIAAEALDQIVGSGAGERVVAGRADDRACRGAAIRRPALDDLRRRQAAGLHVHQLQHGLPAG